jgi:hypothetical protein
MSRKIDGVNAVAKIDNMNYPLDIFNKLGCTRSLSQETELRFMKQMVIGYIMGNF